MRQLPGPPHFFFFFLCERCGVIFDLKQTQDNAMTKLDLQHGDIWMQTDTKALTHTHTHTHTQKSTHTTDVHAKLAC